MPAVQPPAKVLVTGASGFIAAWVVRTLLERGFVVVGTVRSQSKGEFLKKQFASYGDKFSYAIVEDIEKEGAFDEVVKDVEAVEHTASPFRNDADDPAELITPAVQGTLGILRSVLEHGPNVKRVVVTSSMAAVFEPGHPIKIWTETDWNNHDPKTVEEQGKAATGTAKYRASKALAERAAWDFMEKNKGSAKFDLTVINPPWVYGPFIHDVPYLSNLNTSLAYLRNNVFIQPPTGDGLSAAQGSWVDVRDAAITHVNAIEKEEAGGQRFISSAGPWSWQEILDGIHSDPGFAPTLPVGSPGTFIKHRSYGSGEKATRVLGVQYRSLKDSARDTVEALRKRGWAETK